eukprot:gene11545-13478_t
MFTFKVCFEGDVRRFSCSTAPTYTELVIRLNDLFHLKEPFIITYLDEEPSPIAQAVMSSPSPPLPTEPLLSKPLPNTPIVPVSAVPAPVTVAPKSNPHGTIFSQVPKIFNHIPFPFSSKPAEVKKEEPIIIQVPSMPPPQHTYHPHMYHPQVDPLSHAHLQSQPLYPIHPMNVPLSPQQLSQIKFHPLPQVPNSTSTQPQLQSPLLMETPQYNNQSPPSVSLVQSSEKITALMDALRINEQRAKEMLSKYNGNAEDAMIMESTE